MKTKIRITLEYLIGALFILSGWLKITNLKGFAESVAGFELLPATAVSLITFTLPPLEILLGILLFFPAGKRVASLGLLLLCSGFTLGLAQAIARGLSVDCGCFGDFDPVSKYPLLALLRALLLGTASAWIYWTHINPKNPQECSPKKSS